MIKNTLTTIAVFLRKNRQSILPIIVLTIAGDILLFGESSDIRLFPIISLYLFAIWFYKLKSRITFRLALFILAIMFVLLIFTSTSANTEKAAVWLFFLIAIGIVQKLRE